jgi:predicted dehydrogenase
LIKRIGIIGRGSIGKLHHRLIKNIRPDLEVFFINTRKKKHITNANDIQITEVSKKIVDAVIIATPSTLHVEQAIFLMKKEVHILIEKPLSNSSKNLDHLRALEAKKKITVLIGYCLRYNSAAITFFNLLQNRKFGKILHVQVDCGSYLPNWREGVDYRRSVSARSELGGGVLLELSHEFDYLRWFFGEVHNVAAVLRNSGSLEVNVEDSADMIFESKIGFIVNVHLDFNSRNSRRTCSVRCENGDLIWDLINQNIILNAFNKPKEIKHFNSDRDVMFREQLKHFFNCIENKDAPKIGLKDGVAVLKIIKSIKESNKTGKKITIN